MRPDLVTVCVGMNDMVRPGRWFDTALVELETVYTRLAETGATVVTTTFPTWPRSFRWAACWRHDCSRSTP